MIKPLMGNYNYHLTLAHKKAGHFFSIISRSDLILGKNTYFNTEHKQKIGAARVIAAP